MKVLRFFVLLFSCSLAFAQRGTSPSVLSVGLLAAVDRHDASTVERLLRSSEASPNSRDKAGHRALTSAAQTGDLRVMRILLDAGADVNAKDVWGIPAIFQAAVFNHEGSVKLLLEHGADANVTDSIGRTALFPAARHDAEDTILMLLKMGGDINHVDQSGDTALTESAKENHPESVEFLRKHGAVYRSAVDEMVATAALGDSRGIRKQLAAGVQINGQDGTGTTPLMAAAWMRQVPVVKLLLQHGADLGPRDKRGETALLRALGSPGLLAEPTNDGVIAQMLLDAGADARDRNDDGTTTLMYAVWKRDVPMVKRLLGGGADVNAVTQWEGSTALLWSAVNGNVVLMKVLLDAGAAVNVQCKNGETAILRAAKAGHMDAVRLLLQAGANPTLKDSKGQSAMDYGVVRKTPSVQPAAMR